MTSMLLEPQASVSADRRFGPPGTVAPTRIRICDETAHDRWAREALLSAAFGPSRFEKASERLRQGRLPAAGLALVAKDGNELVGTLRLWNVLAGKRRPSLLLGPLAVAASHRSRGVGTRLIGEALSRAVAFGHRSVLLVGDSSYYGRFGFEPRFARNLTMPGPVDPARFLGLELVEGALQGACGAVKPSGAIAARIGAGFSAHRVRPDA